jgi:predicted unusual protein kinase regulating ubiquinone biosynthesis (AarF/ABC1/UbiB family)
VVFLDAGLVTILNEKDRLAFLKLMLFVLLRRPVECGHTMLELAQ